MPSLKVMCRVATTFSGSGELDEDAFRQHLGRLVESKASLYVASGGLGEAYAMSLAEIRRVYEIAVGECKGRVPVYANPPEQHTPAQAIMHARLAIDAGVDAVNIYPITGWHGFRPTEDELRSFYDEVLTEIRAPVILSAIAVVGYMPAVKVMAETIRRHRHVMAINVHADERYLVNLRDQVDRDIEYYFPPPGFLNALILGATGVICPEANIIPRSWQRFLELCEQRDYEQMGPLYASLLRYKQLLDRWYPNNARPTKMAMKVLKLPGCNLRPPNRMPPEDQLQALADGLLRLGLPEVDELARAAGLGR